MLTRYSSYVPPSVPWLPEKANAGIDACVGPVPFSNTPFVTVPLSVIAPPAKAGFVDV